MTVTTIAEGLTPLSGRNSKPYLPRPVDDVIDWHETVCNGEGGCADPTGHNLAAEIVRLRATIAAVEQACPICGGAGWTTDAEPLPSGDPLETFQVPCWDAEHSVILNAPAALTPEGPNASGRSVPLGVRHMTTPREQSDPFPWIDTGETWYAALVDGGMTYGLARRRRDAGGEFHETWNRETLAWQPTTAGAGYFSELGGITDAVPIDAAEAMRVLEELGGSPTT